MVARVPHLVQVEEITTMKLHDLHAARPAPRTRAPGRSRHRRARAARPPARHEGPGRPQHRVAPVRGRPDAAAPPHAEGQGVHEPVPGRVRASSTSTRSRRSTPAPRSTPATLRSHGLVAKRGSVKVLGAGRAHQGAHRARTRFSAGCDPRRSKAPAAAPRRPAAAVRRPASHRPRERPHQPISSPIPPTRRSRPPCLSRLRNMFRVPDLRNKILFTICHHRGSTGSAPTCRSRTSTSAIKDLQKQSDNSGRRRASSTCSPAARITNVAIFFLGIMPYITASIIMQLLGRRDPEARAVAATRARSGRRRSPSGPATSPSASRSCSRPAFVFALHQGSERPARVRRLPGPRPDPRLHTPRRAAHRAHLDGRHRAWSCGSAELITQRASATACRS